MDTSFTVVAAVVKDALYKARIQVHVYLTLRLNIVLFLLDPVTCIRQELLE